MPPLRASRPMPMKKRTAQRWIAILLLGFSAGAALRAQASDPYQVPQRGIVPTGVYGTSPVDSVDAVSGNLILRIPITSLPPGPGGFTKPLDLYYNSAIYAKAQDNNDGSPRVFSVSTVDALTSGGWRYGYE